MDKIFKEVTRRIAKLEQTPQPPPPEVLAAQQARFEYLRNQNLNALQALRTVQNSLFLSVGQNELADDTRKMLFEMAISIARIVEVPNANAPGQTQG